MYMTSTATKLSKPQRIILDIITSADTPLTPFQVTCRYNAATDSATRVTTIDRTITKLREAELVAYHRVDESQPLCVVAL